MSTPLAPVFSLASTQYEGISLLKWDTEAGFQSVTMPSEVAAYIVETCNGQPKLIEALEACRVFTTPLERLKGWNQFKEDAARRVRRALDTLAPI